MSLVKIFGIIFCLIIVSNCESKESPNEVKNELAHGFGHDIEWIAWNDAIAEAKKLKKPIFLLIHKSWCAACQALKTTFSTSSARDEFVELSKNFVMVNTEDHEEPVDAKYSPDGGYIPRTLFLDSKGDVMKEVNNHIHYPSNKHYFPQMPTLIKAMKIAVELFNSKVVNLTDEKVEEPEDATHFPEQDDEATPHSSKEVENEVLDDEETDDFDKETENEPKTAGKSKEEL